MSHLALCGRHHWTHHDDQLSATNLITVLFWPEFRVSVPLCSGLRCSTSADPLPPRALHHPYQTCLPTVVLSALSFNRAACSTSTTLVTTPFLFTIPIELASFALVASGSVQQALSAMPPARSGPLSCAGIADKTLYVRAHRYFENTIA